jgi:hypothetical protein
MSGESDDADARPDSVVFSVRMPRALHQQLAMAAQADDSSVNRAVIVAVRRYVRAAEARRQRRLGAQTIEAAPISRDDLEGR